MASLECSMLFSKVTLLRGQKPPAGNRPSTMNRRRPILDWYIHLHHENTKRRIIQFIIRIFQHLSITIDSITSAKSIKIYCIVMSPTLKYHCLLVGTLLYNELPASAFSPNSLQPSKNTCIRMSRSNERAHMEKQWENMMDNDWREFRATLIAKEKADELAAEKIKTKVGAGSLDEPPREDKLGDLITGAFTSFFKGGKDEEKDMFKGNVGGANPNTQFTSIDFPSECEDPFLSVEECHILYSNAQKVKINKHRWAHPLSHVEPGCVLVANEKLGGVFHQTVVLIIDHHEKIGSTGLIINRPFPGDLLKTAADSEKCNIDTSLKMTFSKAPVSYGGPVMQDQFSTLHGYGLVEGSKKVCQGVFVGGSAELMGEVRKKTMDPKEVLFIKGHAAWVPGQLSREIEKGVWYVAACSADFILRYAGAPVSVDDNPRDLWADILSCMGENYETVAKMHSGRGDKRMAP
ncbi:hypothetical protein ACHAWO_008738 [Cyclotella atomus]|uniref:Transcriptional regulator n=1 Tax=Cyclotella atomus TaxID=382360 RepID=A0ABD3NM32_9STRA